MTWQENRSSFPGRPTRPTIVLMAGVSIMLMLVLAAHQYSSNYGLQPYLRPETTPAKHNSTPTHTPGKCPAEVYAAGSWQPANKFPPGTKMKQMSDAITFGGFEGCASNREFFWHLASDHPDQWENRYPMAYDHVWTPPEECGIRPLDREALVTDLVQKGGWLLIGDSVTENHFFSLSCLLSPHVRATPNYTANPYYERDWQQNLYLLPTSPLIPHLKFPDGFSIEHTPLVSFRRVDLLLSRQELEGLYNAIYAPDDDFSLFSDTDFWSLSPHEYVRQFTSPRYNYQTMIVSTAGHWTTNLFQGMQEPGTKGDGIGGVLYFFQHVTAMWADLVQGILDVSDRNDRQVIVRAYLSGHEDCSNHFEPYTYIHGYTLRWWNWDWIPEFNDIFQVCTLIALSVSSILTQS